MSRVLGNSEKIFFSFNHFVGLFGPNCVIGWVSYDGYFGWVQTVFKIKIIFSLITRIDGNLEREKDE